MEKFEEIKSLLDNSSIFYLIAVDMNSRYSYINTRYQRVFHGLHGNLVGQHYSVTVHPDDQETCNIVAAQCFSNPGAVFPAVIRKHDGKGGFIITQWEYKAMLDKNNSPAGIFCIGHDITEFMQANTALKDVKASLTETKLRLAQIAYTQSHMVRKPIANIIGLSQLLDTTGMNPSVKNIINMISESARELDQVIKKVYAKL